MGFIILFLLVVLLVSTIGSSVDKKKVKKLLLDGFKKNSHSILDDLEHKFERYDYIREHGTPEAEKIAYEELKFYIKNRKNDVDKEIKELHKELVD